MKSSRHYPHASLGEIFQPLRRKNSKGVKRVLTVSGEHGLVDQTEFFDRDIASKDLSNYWLLKKGEFTYNRSFMSGYPVGAIKQLTRYAEGCVSPIYLCFALNNTECDAAYYAYVFESGVLTQELMGIVQAGARAHGMLNVAKEDFLELVVPKPSLNEQKKIVKILSAWDSAIDVLSKLIEHKIQVKKSLTFKLMQGELRAPGFRGKWAAKSIGEFAECTAGGTPSTAVDSYWGGTIRWMSSGELNKKFVYEVDGRITPQGLSNSSTKLIPPKCVLIGLAGQGKTRGTVAMNMVELCTNQSIAAILPNDSFVPEYLYYNLDARYKELRKLSAGDGGRGGLNLSILKSLVVPFPEVEEQNVVAKILLVVDQNLVRLKEIKKKLILQKTGLMQKLLTGQIKVKLG